MSKQFKHLIQQLKKQLPLLLGEVYCCIMFIAMEPFWAGYINEKCFGLIQVISECIDNCYINFVNTVCIVALCIYSFVILRKKHLNLVVFPIICTIAWLMVFGNIWQAKETVIPCVKYNNVVFIWCILFVFVKLYDALKTTDNKTSDKETENIIGFTIDRENENKVNVGWQSICDTLSKKLSKTNFESESFAIGITGKWGSGKTTFLGNLKSKLKDDFIIVDYNPWNCQNPSKIVEDFFLRLKETICGEDELIKSINKYSDALRNIDALNLMTSILGVFQTEKEKSIQSLKEKINEISKLLEKPIAIIIDDIDRLDKDETLEILKIVRITANFANMVFVVAYDSSHVVKMLSENGIENGQEYLKKMFQLEYSLPAYEDYKIQEVLFTELAKIIKNENDLNQLKRQILEKDKNTDQYLMPKFLPNFRDVKRFVNIFALNQVLLSKFEGDYDVIDLFWLELLHYFDIETYNELYQNRSYYIETRGRDDKGLVFYRLKRKNHLIKEDNLDSLFLLSKLFDSRLRNKNQICYEINFLNYFCFRLPEYGISCHIIVELINEHSVDDELIKNLELIVKGNINKHKSFIAQLAKIDVQKLTFESQKRFICMLAWAGNKFNIDDIRSVFDKQLNKNLYLNDYILNFNNYLLNIIKSYLDKGDCYEKWARLLCSLYPVCYIDDEGDENYTNETLLSESDINDLIKYIFELFIENRGGFPDSKDIKECSVLSAFITTTFLYFSVGEHDQETKTNLVFDILLKHYSENKSKNFSDFRKQFELDSDRFDEDEIVETYVEGVLSVFGNREDYKKFVYSCFEVDKQVIDDHIKRIGF